MSTNIVLSRERARQIDAAADAELGISGLVLMENAARGVCDFLCRMRPVVRRPAIVCGYGNNGGDGLALARQLSAKGMSSDVYLLSAGRPLSHDAATNLRILRNAGIDITECDAAQCLETAVNSGPSPDLIVDCLLGTGVHGTVREPFGSAIQWINRCALPVLSVDVPSGLDCDTGEPCGVSVEATATVTFVGVKQGFLAPPAGRWTGRVEVAHIGLPSLWLAAWLSRQRSVN